MTAGLALAVMAGVAPRPAAAACAPDGAETVRVAAIRDDWSVALDDGRAIRLAGIDPVQATAAHPALATEARARLEGWLAGKPASLVPIGSGTDRWGRIDGLLFAPGGPAPDSGSESNPASLAVAVALVDAGLARGRPERAAAACWPAIRAAETGARSARLGLWDDPAYAILHPADRGALEQALGSMILLEGRVMRIGRGRSRLFLRLGERGSDVSVSVATRDLFILDQLGLNRDRLVGAELRVRGDLEDRSGFSMDVTEAGQIEVLSGPAESGAPVARTGAEPPAPGAQVNEDNEAQR